MQLDKSHTDHLRQTVRTIIRHFGFLQKSESTCCGVTLSQCHALTEIGNHGSITLNELAEILNLDKSTMSRNIDTLVNSGLVERETDPTNRRSIKIKLTEQGGQTFDYIENSMNRYFESILQHIPENKRNTVIESLCYLEQALAQCRYDIPENSCCRQEPFNNKRSDGDGY